MQSKDERRWTVSSRYNPILTPSNNLSMTPGFSGLPAHTNDPSIRPDGPLPRYAVIDTCVLMSTILKNLLLRLAQNNLFEPVWADYIGEEWRRNASRVWEVSEEEIAAEWQAMQDAFPQANMGVVHQFETGLARSDPKDWHVIAAGRAALSLYPARSVCILTRNLRDFNRSELRQFGLSLYSPDEFLVKCYEAEPDLLMQLLTLIPSDAAAIGRPAEPLEAVLRRERLFRLNNLILQDANAAA